MLTKVLLCCLVACAAAGTVVVKQHAAQPYSFGYDNVDEFGTRLIRQETGDAFNKVGSYSYVDAKGLARTVNYIADAAGFRATVNTNEPGTKSSAPANALYNSAAGVVASKVLVKAAPVVHSVAPVGVYPSPVGFTGRHVAPMGYY